jgi:hypothetical protein
MYDITIRIHAFENSEFSAEDLHELEYKIEDIVSCTLLQLFDTVAVIDVTVCYTPTGQIAASFSIQSA